MKSYLFRVAPMRAPGAHRAHGFSAHQPPEAPRRAGRRPCRYEGRDASPRLTSDGNDHRLMTMITKKRRIPAGKFKAQCLALLDEVAATGVSLVITKRGKPVARLGPLEELPSLRGSVTYHGDIVAPLDVTWEAAR